MTPTRRGFIGGVAALFCAPAIVRASSLMAVRAPGLVVTRNFLPDMDQIYPVGMTMNRIIPLWEFQYQLGELCRANPNWHKALPAR